MVVAANTVLEHTFAMLVRPHTWKLGVFFPFTLALNANKLKGKHARNASKLPTHADINNQ